MTATLRATLAFALLCASLSVAAHPGDAASHGLITGFTHPFEGLDHLLAMVAVGLWAARARGWSVWIAPAVFLSGMLAGGFAGIAGLVPPFVEAGVAGSTIALCVLVVIGLSPRSLPALAAIALFGAYHGVAHGLEMPEGTTGIACAGGFLAATALLHALGVGLGRLAALKTARRGCSGGEV
jgi:urease accessory protein